MGNQVSRSSNEPSISETISRLKDGCAERRMEDNAMHQLLTTLVEQTNVALKEEASRLSEALRTHNHDIMVDTPHRPGLRSVQIQELASKLNHIAFSPPVSASQPGLPMIGSSALAPRDLSTQVAPPMSQRALTGTVPNSHSLTHAAMTGSISMYNLVANEPSTHHKEMHQCVNRFPQQNNACNFGGGSQLRSLDQQPRILLSGLQNGL